MAQKIYSQYRQGLLTMYEASTELWRIRYADPEALYFRSRILQTRHLEISGI